MKKIIFLIAALMYSLAGISQQIVLNSTANVNPSKKFEKLNKEQATFFANRKFNNDKNNLPIVTNTDHTYLVDSVLVILFYENKQVPDDHLLQTKKEMDALFKKLHTYTSSIETINNNKLLILNYTMYHAGYYRFFCYNADNSKVVSGTLQFDVSDKDKASIVLDDLLKNIQFTTN